MRVFIYTMTVLVLLALNSCGGRQIVRCVVDPDENATSFPDTTGKVINDITAEGYRYADSVLAGLTLEQKAGMPFMPAIFAKSDAVTMQRLLEYADRWHVGGVVLLKGDLKSASDMADTLQNLGGTGYFIAVDAENGLRMRFSDAPEFPWNRELGRLSDDQLMYEFGREIARECRIAGINMILGPVMDVVPGESSHGLMRKRSFGSDPKRVSELAIAYSHGLEDGNVISVAKHFPGHGSSNADSHKRLGEISSSRARIDSVDLFPFRKYIEEGMSGVMVGHLSARALDPERRPAVVSPLIMGNILRDELGFRGLVITDALNMEGAMGIRAYEAIMAGADIIIAPADTEAEINALLKAVESGEVPEGVLDDRCRRIIFYKYLLHNGEVRGRKKRHPHDIVREINADAVMIRDTIVSGLRSRSLEHPGF